MVGVRLVVRERLSSFLRKFWLWLYLWAGRRVGPETAEFWDQHWWTLVAYRMRELARSDMGANFITVLFGDIEVTPPSRETRPRTREVRSGRT